MTQRNHGSFFALQFSRNAFIFSSPHLAATVYILSYRSAEVNKIFLECGVEFHFKPPLIKERHCLVYWGFVQMSTL